MKAKITIEIEIDPEDTGDMLTIGRFANLVWHSANATFDNFATRGVVWAEPSAVFEAAKQEDRAVDHIRWERH